MKRLLLILGLSVFLFSCKKEKNEIDFGYDYFPLTESHYVEYDVMHVFHDKDLNPQHDTVRYRLKTVMGEKVLDNEGREATKLFRYAYDSESGELLDQRVWTTIIDGKRGEVVEENQRRIRMVFPVRVGNEWNVNAYTVDEEQLVYYEDFDVARTVNGHYLEQTTKIHYDDFLSLVDYRKMHEVYARGVGLVERSFKDFAINNFDTLSINKGTEEHYRLIGFGKE